jgi:hypothetical protein
VTAEPIDSVTEAKRLFWFRRRRMASPFAHGSIALVVKRIFPTIPLWLLVVATQIPDILFFLFKALGVETQALTTQDIHYGIQYQTQAFIPWSHGLSMCLVWSALVAALAFLMRKNTLECVIVGTMVLLHWILDAIVYSNLPLFFDHSIQIGFGLATFGTGFVIGIVIEALLIVGSTAFYKITRKKRSTALK